MADEVNFDEEATLARLADLRARAEAGEQLDAAELREAISAIRQLRKETKGGKISVKAAKVPQINLAALFEKPKEESDDDGS